MTKTPKTALPPRLCACGCGVSFTPVRDWHRFKEPSHRKRAWRKRSEHDLWLVARDRVKQVVDQELEDCRGRIYQRLTVEGGKA